MVPAETEELIMNTGPALLLFAAPLSRCWVMTAPVKSNHGYGLMHAPVAKNKHVGHLFTEHTVQ